MQGTVHTSLICHCFVNLYGSGYREHRIPKILSKMIQRVSVQDKKSGSNCTACELREPFWSTLDDEFVYMAKVKYFCDIRKRVAKET